MVSNAQSANEVEHVDVVIVGAGLAGIGAAQRLQTRCPTKTYVVLEARDAIGGTWDLFRYPGVRSDSDAFTLSYAFRPWTDAKSLADGETILQYIRDTATEYGIDRNIRFGTKVVHADFSTERSVWTLTVEERQPGKSVEVRTLTTNFLYTCTGYYDHERPYDPQLPGLDAFTGTVVHPQFWPTR